MTWRHYVKSLDDFGSDIILTACTVTSRAFLTISIADAVAFETTGFFAEAFNLLACMFSHLLCEEKLASRLIELASCIEIKFFRLCFGSNWCCELVSGSIKEERRVVNPFAVD